MDKAGIQLAGVGEKVQYLVHDFNDNTIRFVIHYPGIVDPDLLCVATRAVIEGVDILHASFLTSSIGAYWKVNTEYEKNDFFQYVQVEENPFEKACEYSLLPIAPESKTQLCCHLVQDNAESVIVLRISHLCVDGSDGKYLLGKLAETYCMILDNGDADRLVVKNGNRAAEQVYEGIGKREYLSLLKNPISRVKSEFPYPTEDSGKNRLVCVKISETIMTEARKKAKSMGATANDILLAACYHAYAALSGIDAAQPMSIMSMIDLRRHCKDGDSEGLCNMTGAFPTTLEKGLQKCVSDMLENELEGDFSDTLEEVVKQTQAMKENPLAGLEGMPLLHGVSKTLPMGVLLKIVGKLYGSFSIGLTNIGNISGELLKLGELMPDGGLFGGPLKKKPGMQISVVGLEGACTLSVVGEYTEEDAKLLQTMLDRMVEEIEKYATR